MNFKYTIACSILLGLAMQMMVASDTIGNVGIGTAGELSGASLEQLPWLYRWMMYHSYKAAEDAAALMPGAAKACWNYTQKHPLGAFNMTMGTALAALIYYKWSYLQDIADRVARERVNRPRD